MAAHDPALVRDLGFCLSCVGDIRSRGAGSGDAACDGRPAGTRWRMALAVSWAAQAATLPWSLATFSYLTPAAPLLNLFAVPLAGLLLVGALGWIALALALPVARDVAALPLDLLADAVPVAARACRPRPWLCLPLPPSWGLGLGLAVLALARRLEPAVGTPRLARSACC